MSFSFFRDVVAKLINAEFQGHTSFKVADNKAVGDNPVRELHLDAVPVNDDQSIISLAWDGGNKLFEKTLPSEEAKHNFELISSDMSEAVSLTSNGKIDEAKKLMESLVNKYSEQSGEMVPTNLPPVTTTQAKKKNVCETCEMGDCETWGCSGHNEKTGVDCECPLHSEASQYKNIWKQAKVSLRNIFPSGTIQDLTFDSQEELSSYQEKMKQLNPQDQIPLWDINKGKAPEGEESTEIAPPSLSYDQIEKEKEKEHKNLEKSIDEKIKTEVESALIEKAATVFGPDQIELVEVLRKNGRNWDEIKKILVKDFNFDKEATTIFVDDLRSKEEGPEDILPEAPKPPENLVSPETHDKLLEDLDKSPLDQKKSEPPVKEEKEPGLSPKDIMDIPEEKESAQKCPKCGEDVWDVSGGGFTGAKLNKCWNCGTAFDNPEMEEIARADNAEIRKVAKDIKYLSKKADNPLVTKNFSLLMKQLAQAVGGEWDGGTDQRIFLEERIDVFANIMTPEEYAAMEKDLNEFEIHGNGYDVYGSNDVSGYEYWKREGEWSDTNNPGSGNYIIIAASVKPEALPSINPEELKNDLQEALAHFSIYHNIEDYFNQHAQITSSLKKQALNPLQEPPVVEKPTAETSNQDIVPISQTPDHDTPAKGDRVFVMSDLGDEKAGFEGTYVSEYTSKGNQYAIIETDEKDLLDVEMHRVSKVSENTSPEPSIEPNIQKPEEPEIEVTPKMEDLHSSLKESSEIYCKNSDCKRKATVRLPEGNFCEKHAPANKESSLEDIKAEVKKLEAQLENFGKISYKFIKKGLEKHANDSAYEANGWTRVWVDESEIEVEPKYAEILKLPDENARIAALKDLAREVAQETLSLKANAGGDIAQMWFESLTPSDRHDRIDWVALASPEQVESSLKQSNVMDTKCEDCGKPLGPEVFLSNHPVCGDCTRKKHKKVTGTEKESALKVGDRVQVSEGSGVDSGVMGIVVSQWEFNANVGTNERMVPNIPGYYKPVDWAREVPIKLEDGSYITMFKNRLSPVVKSSLKKADKEQVCYNCQSNPKPDCKECGGTGWINKKAADPVPANPTQLKDVKITPDYVQKEKAVPASPEQSEVIAKMQAIEANLSTLDRTKEEVKAKLTAELKKIDDVGERASLEAEYKNQIEKLSILIDAVDSKLIKYNDMFYAFQQGQVKVVPKLTPKELLEKIYKRFSDAEKFVQDVTNGMLSLAKSVTTRTLTRWPEKRSDLNKSASVSDELNQMNQQMLEALNLLSEPLA